MAKAPKQKRGPKTLLEKVDEKYPNYSQEVLGLSVPQLDQRIAELQKTLEDSEQHREEKQGEALRSLKEELKSINGPYNDVKKAVALKTKLLVSLVREKGGK
jgi:hypothetical protein